MKNPHKKRYGIAWFILIMVPFTFELWAIANVAEGDTLSEHVMPFLRAHPFVWFVSLSLYTGIAFWLGWHWWFEAPKDKED